MPSLSGRQAEGSEPFPKICGCSNLHTAATLRASEEAVEATAEEIASVRNQLNVIEQLLNTLFGETWSREPSSLKARRMAAELIEEHFEGIVAEWEQSVAQVFGGVSGVERIDISPAFLNHFVEMHRHPVNAAAVAP